MGFVMKAAAAFLLALSLSTAPTQAQAQERTLVMASTTSTEQSGLFAHLLPAFKKASGIEVRVVAQGTGQALDMGRRGDADLLFVHDQVAEEKFVAEGFGLARRAVMFNDFVLVGPALDPAGVRGQDVVAGLNKLSSSKAIFVSRGDKSGTHAAELRFWKAAGIGDPSVKADGSLFDYRACGCGMGPALNIASSVDGYVLTDRGTWLSFKNRGNLAVLVQGDRRLFNQYGVIVVNPAKHPHTKTTLAQAFSDWVVSPEGQASISAYKIGGEQLFFPNANN
ncbi:extracellular solute-binding protein [Paucibacter sp. TC2R-5]|uniref:substrate-binding domain-containing protein n=1 Tax=Paucibacter sp. TC2R-5 TaxID=2893555 RepID=UPI0021E4A664|nr:substrate-binding domain-containing protein [Paucibacter sp. TC2R-5]MCV2357762.1 extracellular solute-binding protein [Paucibacter sp. TC2R-5]